MDAPSVDDGNARAAQQRFLLDSQLRKQAAQTVLPTSVESINSWFREIGEPIILFGETLVDRRNRLGIELSRQGGLDAFPRLRQSLSVKKIERAEKWGRRLGGEGIIDVRRRILEFWNDHKLSIRTDGSSCVVSEIELVGASCIGNRPSSSGVCLLQDYVVVSDREGNASFVNQEELGEVYSLKLQSASHIASHSTRLVCSGFDGHIRLYDHSSPDKLETVSDAHKDHRVCQSAWHPSGDYFVSCGADSKWKLWDAGTQRMIFELCGHHHRLGIKSIGVEPHGGALVSTGGGDGALRIWDSRMGRCIMTGIEHVDGITCTAFINACLVMSGGLDNKIAGWDLRQTDRPVYTICSHTSAITSLTGLSTSTFVSTSLDNSVSVWDGSLGRQLAATRINDAAKPTASCFNAAKNLLYTNGLDHTLRQHMLK